MVVKNNSLVNKIARLKSKRKAIILAHNYQLPEVQDIADYRGDSLELSRQAARTRAKVIVFCGVDFMAETAAVVCPDKLILMPDLAAGCPMAKMITPEKLGALKQKHPGAKVVCYVNTSAAVKAESDICCTSANAIGVVRHLKDTKEIIFVPDKYLADYVSRVTGRKLIAWDGYCPSHVKILAEDIKRQKRLHPKAQILVHPECTPKVIDLADQVLSTSGMCRFAKKSRGREFIIGTEPELIYRLSEENPTKMFYPATKNAICPTMKLTSLEKVLWALEDMKHRIRIPRAVAIKARRAVDRMLRVPAA